MQLIVDFDLVSSVEEKDSLGQVHTTPSYTSCVGVMKSVYEKEFFQASQNGIRPSFVIETFFSNYGGEKQIRYNDEVYTIYRTYRKGTDKIELYCEERVGNGK